MVTDSDWQHPTGKVPKRICILGLGPTSQHWHQGHAAYNPSIPRVDEIWTVNKGFRTARADVVFIMDDLVEEARRSRRYGAEIAQLEIPVITSTVDDQVKRRWPKALKYPLSEVLTFWGSMLLKARGAPNENPHRLGKDPFLVGVSECGYFNNSIPYMLAYAGYIGVKQVTLWGVDYNYPGTTAREDDKANAEYWVAALEFGLGIDIDICAQSTLLNTRNRGVYYGFNGRQPF